MKTKGETRMKLRTELVSMGDATRCYEGSSFKIVGAVILHETEFPETMIRVQFPDGHEVDAFVDEIFG
jgi:hypothetical protein